MKAAAQALEQNRVRSLAFTLKGLLQYSQGMIGARLAQQIFEQYFEVSRS
jgi:hypothetical protein